MNIVPRMKTGSLAPLGMSLPLWLSLMASTSVWAQTAEPAAQGTVEDVVVSAPPETTTTEATTQQQLQKVQSSSTTSTVVTQQQLEAAQIQDLQAAQKLEPSLNIKFSNVRNIAINVRGFGAASSSATDAIFGGTPIYLNGVYQPFVGQAIMDIPDLVGIEVLKGPQATSGGQDSTGGAVYITTAGPSFTPEQKIEFTYGSYSEFIEKGSVTGPIAGTDWAAFRFSFFDKDQAGYLRSTTDGNEYNGMHDKGGMAQFLITPSNDLTALFTLNYTTVTEAQTVAGYAGVITNYANTGAPFSNGFLARAARIGVTVPPANQLLSTYTTPGAGWQNTADDSYMVSAKIDYTFNGFSIDSVTSAQAWDFHPHNGYTTTPGAVAPIGQGSQIDAKAVTQDLKISTPKGGPVDVTAGTFFLWDLLIDHGRSTPFGPLAGPFYGSPSTSTAINNAALNYLGQSSYDNPTTTEIAPYIQDVWHATSNLDITTGARYSYNYKNSSFYQWIDDNFPTGPNAAAISAAQTSSKGSNTFWDVSTHQGIVSLLGNATYKFTPDVFGYVTVSQGGRAGGPNPATGNLPTTLPHTVAAERLDNFEVGLKSSWFDQKLTANLATFMMVDHNYIAFAQSLQGSTPVPYLANAKRADSRGVELDLRAKPIEGLSLYGSLTYDDAYYASFQNGSCPSEIAPGPTTCNLTGKPLANTPKWTFVVGGEYSHPIGNLLAAVVDKSLVAYTGADFTFQTEFFSDETGATNDSQYALIHPYGLLDVHAGIKFEDGSWDLVGWVHNALNHHYYTSIGPTTGGEIVATVGDPLMAGVTLRAKF